MMRQAGSVILINVYELQVRLDFVYEPNGFGGGHKTRFVITVI